MQKALLVDDIPEYVDTLEVYLEDRFEIIKAGSLIEAKAALDGAEYALALVDIRLDENSSDNKEGLELLRWIKVKSPDTPVIVMSAYREFDLAVEALNAGAEYFIRKPVNLEELRAIIDKLK
jgi:DNA-binding NtrC family response regulator